jgi:hypothetical protein
MEIVSRQQDDEAPGVWRFKIAGPAAGGEIRLADLSRETEDPETWLADNEAEAQAAIDAGVFNEVFSQGLDLANLSEQITSEIDWVSDTALTDIDSDLATIDAMTATQVRAAVKKMLQRERRGLLVRRVMLRAWRYVIRRLG